MNTAAFRATLLLLIGCTLNFFVLESMLNYDPKSGKLITIAQFLFVSFEGLFYHVEFSSSTLIRFKKLTIPLWYYAILVILFFTQAIINNIVFGYNISMPLHSIFRSGSLVTSVLIGFALFKQKYSLRTCIFVVLITIGIFMATIASGKEEKKVFNVDVDWNSWLTGIFLLTLSQFFSALLGHLQQYGYGKYGKNWRETMFYTHALSLPFFLFMSQDVIEHATIYNNSPPLSLIAFSAPRMWVLMALNLVTQIFCVTGVNQLSAATNALTLTIALTVRKFISLVISIFYFGNAFTPMHWLATVLVFGGSMLATIYPDKQQDQGKKQQ